MSFTAEVKDELSRVKPTCQNCDKSELSALLRTCGSLYVVGKKGYRLEVSTETGAVARIVIKLAHSVYNLQPELTVRRSVLHRTRNYLITLHHQPGLGEALLDMGVLSSPLELERGIKPSLVENDCCAAAYVRGMFLAGGFISHPRGDFHFEMATQYQKLAQDATALLERLGVATRLSKRRSEYTIYIKSVESMLKFLAVVQAHQSALAIESVRVVKALRNDVNRQVNAEMANQAKSSAASLAQLEQIALIEKHIGFDKLPQALADFCRLRRAYPTLNLRELGEMADPPLSKSAVYHRVRRLESLARTISES